MSEWQSPYLRTTLFDIGVYPRQSLVPISPDIIDFGVKKASNPQDLVAGPNWDRYLGGCAVADEVNQLYVRTENLSAKAVVDAEVRLYCTPASLVLWPTRPDHQGWAEHPLKTADGEETQFVSARAKPGRVATELPFELPAGPAADYSLIAWLQTPKVPNPIPDVKDIADVGSYVRFHPDTATLLLQAAPEQPAHPRRAWSKTMDFFQGAVARNMLFSIDVLNGNRNDEFRISSRGGEGKQPEPPLDHTATISGPKTLLDYRSDVPAGWKGEIALEYLPSEPDEPVPADLEVTIVAHALVDESEPAAEHASMLPERNLPPSMLPQGKRFVPVGALRYLPTKEETS